MTRLFMYAGALAAVAATSGEASIESALLPGAENLQLAIAATFGARMTARDWAVIAAVLAFVALNIFLWTLPISQAALFLITFPLGALALLAFIWFAPRR